MFKFCQSLLYSFFGIQLAVLQRRPIKIASSSFHVESKQRNEIVLNNSLVLSWPAPGWAEWIDVEGEQATLQHTIRSFSHQLSSNRITNNARFCTSLLFYDRLTNDRGNRTREHPLIISDVERNNKITVLAASKSNLSRELTVNKLQI